jgi:hypothetical protein
LVSIYRAFCLRKTRLEDEDKSNRPKEGRKEREKKQEILGIRVGHPKLGERRKKERELFIPHISDLRTERAHKREKEIYTRLHLRRETVGLYLSRGVCFFFFFFFFFFFWC